MQHSPSPLSPIRPSVLEVFRQFRQDSSASALLSGLIAVLVGFAGPIVLIYAVAQSATLSNQTVLSWVWAATVLCGVVSVWLSLRFRVPLLSTWSTPGIAFLATALPGIPFPEAVGAFLISGLLVLLLGTIGPLTRLIGRIPTHLAGALNAAILLPFGFHAVQAFGKMPLLVGAMILVYFVLRHFAPRWAVAGVLLIGVAGSAALGLLHPGPISFALTQPQVVMPQFSWRAVLNLALPLTLLAFTGQFVPGFAALKVSGFTPPPAPIIRACGAASLAAAFVGCHTLTLAALLANIVSGPEAHPDPRRRYAAAVYAGVFNIVLGLFAGTFLHIIAVLPQEAIQALAGLALLTAIGSSLQAALATAPGSLASPTVLLVTLSGVALLGIGSAFWGILAGLAVYAAELGAIRSAATRQPEVPTPVQASD
ncbi:benzoate/H(+) symporter BenE family transporter [Deinococcus ruber]|uniref:Benzoate transporter n=1 Tax=Deinococcus ruber TaxID=1848197 RepID=A0A918C7U0_9DEIO|nr:benzoate/H(+) symporter BenE family transporter [Deinococcus ruber]GGR07997.1 benzoate transporter [Deinococcus ruber]